MTVPVIVISGTSSGVGKTSLSLGIMGALRERGLVVQPFKVGPDFLDPLHHTAACGRTSINLDCWMLGVDGVRESFLRAARGADVAVVEGVMGLFDGRDGATEEGSTAQLAKVLAAPTVLVMDCFSAARSAAAMALGFATFDPDLHLAGIILNRVAGAAHEVWLREALMGVVVPTANGGPASLRVLGAVPSTPSVTLPERYLGLHTPADVDDEGSLPGGHAALLAMLAGIVSTGVDLDELLDIAGTACPPEEAGAAPSCAAPLGTGSAAADGSVRAGHAGEDTTPTVAEDVEDGARAGAQPASPCPVITTPSRVRIAVARDRAFCFYYQDNLRWLEDAGAELVSFSPLSDSLPEDISGIYFGGGYPERFCAELASNVELMAVIKAFADAGGVIYAECGGLMYLSQSIRTDNDAAAIPMVGILPFKAIQTGRLTMGYTVVETTPECWLFPPGMTLRGHVFHFSKIIEEHVLAGPVGSPPITDAGPGGWSAPWFSSYMVRPQIPGAKEALEGFSIGTVLASYVHLHFGSCPAAAAALVERCRGVDPLTVAARRAEAVDAVVALEAEADTFPGYSGDATSEVWQTPRRKLGYLNTSSSSPNLVASMMPRFVESATSSPLNPAASRSMPRIASAASLPGVAAAHSLPAPPPAHPVRRRSYLHLHEHSYGGSGGAVPYSAGAEEEGRHPLHSAPGAIPHAPRSVSIQGGIAPHGSGMVIRSARSQPALAAAVGDVATPPRGGGTAISQFELAQVVEERRGTAVHDPVSKGGGSSAIHPTAAHLPTAADACGGSIASLSGAATKWLCLFGLADRVVGIPHDSESPTAVATCAHVTLPLSDDEDSDSDGSVAAPTPHRMSQLPHALGVASNWAGFSPRPMPPTPRRVSPRGIAVNGIALNAAAPELVVYMGAPPAGSVDAATEFDAELHQGVLGARVLPPPRILCLQPRTLDAVLEAALQIGTVAAARPEAVAAVDHLRARLRSVACVVANAGPKPHRPRVLLLSAADPLFSVGWWAADVVALAGGHPVLQGRGEPPRELEWREIVASAPEVLVVAYSRGSAGVTLEALQVLAGLSEWWALPAARAGAVYMADEETVAVPGPQLVAGATALAAAVLSGTGDAAFSTPTQGLTRLLFRRGHRGPHCLEPQTRLE